MHWQVIPRDDAHKQLQTSKVLHPLQRMEGCWGGGTTKKIKGIKKHKWRVTKQTWRYKVYYKENS